jgi:hypothetical protein
MNEPLQIAIEVCERAWSLFKDAVAGLAGEEVDWRPLPQANSINIIVRHLRIESQWHLDAITRGAPMPTDVPVTRQDEIDAVPLDFQANLEKLNALYDEFLGVLRTLTIPEIEKRTAQTYGARAEQQKLPHLLAYHQAMHVAMHCAQIRTIRNLYRSSRGESVKFFPGNPTYPRESRGSKLGS